MTDKALALVTGATAGIGRAFAERLSRDGHDLVIVARNTARLEELASSLPTSVEIVSADLGDDEQLALVEARLRVGDVGMLVNNAGFATNGALHEIPIAEEEMMLRVNVRAVLRLTAAALPSMVENRRGDILNISSMAGFLTGGGAATYSAAKAYVTMFSQSLHASYQAKGIRVVAVCPGFTHTEFHDRAGGQPDVPEFMWLSVDQVVDAALADLAAGRDLSIAGLPYKVIRILTKALPAPVLGVVMSRQRSRRGRD